MRRRGSVPEPSVSDINLADSESKPCNETAVRSVKDQENPFFMGCPERNKPEQMSLYVSDTPADDDLLLGASASPTGVEGGASGDYDHCNDLPPSTSADSMSVVPVEATEEEDPTANYVGLVNQAMTCYVNSLVQTLYMTPEFRNAIYNWEFDGVHETRSIPYQLQRLFLNLQTSSRTAVETTDLTTSFGWQGSEAWHQHDIQELCRVMFDALEIKFKDTKQANLINDLYEGKMLDYVKCLECSTEKSREDTFLDIPLPVKPFGSNVAYNSVEEALRAFVQPETLEGNNQYFCEKCNRKCDAHKGLKFIKFPYLLTLHLKRFDFDYNTMHRIKLTDKVVFPERLNLNSFVPTSTDEHIVEDYNNASNLSSRENIVRCDECSTTDSGSALDDESCHGTDLSSVTTVNEEDSDEGIDVSSSGNNSDEPKGPYNYELFSIMIHSGSASGGHYYAYIKDFDRNQWLCFNDQSVTRITEDDIKKTYGGGAPQKGYYSGVYASSTNAYMLMYRQIDKNRNCSAIQIEGFPPHVQKLLEHMRNQEKMERQNREKQNNSYRLNVYCFHPLTDELMDIRMSMLPDANLKEAVHLAHRRFKLEGLVDVEDCRMVAYNKKQVSVDCSFEDEQNFCDINVNTFFSDWLLEVKQPNTEFKLYKAGGVDMKAYYVDVEADDVREPVVVRVEQNEPVRDIKGKLSELLGVSVYNMKIVITKIYNEPQYLDNDDQSVPLDNQPSEFKIYVANMLDEDLDKEFDCSKLKQIVDRFQHIVYLNVLLPDTDPTTIENVFGPSLDYGGDSRLIENVDRTNSPSLLRVSPQNCAMNCTDAFGDQSNSEDSSLSDSDRTLVGETPQGIFSSSSTSPADQHMVSPMEPPEDSYDSLGAIAMSWEHSTPATASTIKNITYFKVLQLRDCRGSGNNCVAVGSYTKLCKVFIDNRMTLDQFKKHLESVLRLPREYFKIFKQYPTPDDEWNTLSETLRSTKDGQTFTVKLGRTLSSNEYNCKIFLLKPGSTDTNNFLFDYIVSRGQSVAQAKKEILFKAKKQHMLDLSFNKCRLREKCSKKPRKVYLDDQLFADDILILNNAEFYLQQLDQPEKVTSTNQLVLFARHWSPSTLTLHPFEEVILDTSSMNELKNKVSDMSQIPLENIQIAFVRNIFPCDMHLLDIQSVLDWDAKSVDQNFLQVDDGTAFFYRDSREKLKELTYEEKKEISIKENTRLGRMSGKSCSTWEKPLRIHLDNWPSENEDNCID